MCRGKQLASRQISDWNTNKNNIHPSQKQRGDAVKSHRAPLCAWLVCSGPNLKSLSGHRGFPHITENSGVHPADLPPPQEYTHCRGGIKGTDGDQTPPFPLPVYSNHPLLKWEAVSSQKMTGIVIHKGPKPLIPSMTESTGEVGVGEGALWIPDEFSQGGSIRPARGEGEEWWWWGGTGPSHPERISPSCSSRFSLWTSLFSQSPRPFLSFIYLSPSLQARGPFTQLPSVAPSLSVSSSLACRSPEGATLAKQGIWRSEANLLWEVNTGDFCHPSKKCNALRMKVSTGYIQSIAC